MHSRQTFQNADHRENFGRTQMIDIRFPTALQIVLSLALAEHEGFKCTCKMLAEGLGANPSLVRTLVLPLKEDGIIISTVGKHGGVRLARASDQITLRDIYCSITGDKRLWISRPDVPVYCAVSANIGEFFDVIARDAEAAILETLSKKKISDCLQEILHLNKLREARLKSEFQKKGIKAT